MIGREKPGEQSEVAQLIQQTLEQERWQREMMEQRYKQYMDEDEEVLAEMDTLQRKKDCFFFSPLRLEITTTKKKSNNNCLVNLLPQTLLCLSVTSLKSLLLTGSTISWSGFGGFC